MQYACHDFRHSRHSIRRIQLLSLLFSVDRPQFGARKHSPFAILKEQKEETKKERVLKAYFHSTDTH